MHDRDDADFSVAFADFVDDDVRPFEGYGVDVALIIVGPGTPI
jgi:hypothetical protein